MGIQKDPAVVNAGADAILSRESQHPELQNLLRAALESRPTHDLDLIARAYHAAELACRNEYRKSGDLLITHATTVAHILASLNLDSYTLAAGLLHEVVEKERVPPSQVRDEFGEEIAGMVEGVAKIRDFNFQTPEAEQAENFRNMLLSMAQDIRVVLIKFVDRLHNLRTLEHLAPESRQRMALESRDIYAPLAHRLGIARIRWELEDLSLKWLEPEAYRYIQEKINLKRAEREAFIEEARKPLREALENAGIRADIQGRPKNFYSIYKKMKDRGKSFEEIYDLLAIRILVETLPECYHALGLAHALYTPVMARFKDFIATPKSNMYQSLHTTVVGPKGMMLEVQIRTHEMHRTAEVGIAAHWLYKEGRTRISDTDRHMAWLRGLLELQRETTDPHEFLEELKVDLFPSEIYVFTPRGDLFRLPEGSTPVDFAFSIHTDLGLHCMGARVDGHMVPLSTPLQTGSTVEIITSPHQRPSRDWLSFVKSSKARSCIRRWIREEKHAHSVRLGQELLERELKRQKKTVPEADLEDAASGMGIADLEHLYAAIGNGDMSVAKVLRKLFPETRPAIKFQPETPRKKKRSPLKIQGLNHIMFHFAKCCTPIAGDPVIGVITRGRGVSVHRRDCPNIRGLTDRERLVELEWDVDPEDSFTIQIQVTGRDRPNFLRDVSQAMSELNIPVVGGEIRTQNGEVGDRFLITVKNATQLSKLFKRVREVAGVADIIRMENVSENP